MNELVVYFCCSRFWQGLGRNIPSKARAWLENEGVSEGSFGMLAASFKNGEQVVQGQVFFDYAGFLLENKWRFVFGLRVENASEKSFSLVCCWFWGKAKGVYKF